MEELIHQLKTRAAQASSRSEDLFDLLMITACQYCCTTRTGGNEACGPKTEDQRVG
jgi:hypothetical protein